MSRCLKRFALSFILVVLGQTVALGHQTTDSYLALTLTNGAFVGQWSIALRDLNHVLSFDSDNDGEISDSELERAKPGVQKYAYDRLKISVDGGPAIPRHQGFEIHELDDAIYLVLNFNLESGAVGPDMVVEYKLFFETDPLHRGFFRLDLPERTQTTVFSPSHPVERFIVSGAPQKGHQFANFVTEGVWHIWLGFDHILFLLALLLPSVLQREEEHWKVTQDFRSALLKIAKVVTAFTIAHSITLTLASLEVVRLPSRFVESLIAISVLLAAVNNLKAIFPDRTWMIAFGFGLIHGFGFASALTELHLPTASLGLALLGFNLGVEAGQLVIVMAFVPIAFALRKTRFYQQIAMRYGSIVIVALAATWLFERVADRKILPF
jgi:hypothetical protein